MMKEKKRGGGAKQPPHALRSTTSLSRTTFFQFSKKRKKNSMSRSTLRTMGEEGRARHIHEFGFKKILSLFFHYAIAGDISTHGSEKVVGAKST